ncbi:hypothetical protein Fcan01_24178 [Folsomia candida]|uniref:Uncharacterized protein n=1 Tax=Folsomia candida TaxID=158441 RepID=A0A226D7I6_FOLCA|nr:hypothetical protein Fcan01_24178 [Folsomia candida]
MKREGGRKIKEKKYESGRKKNGKAVEKLKKEYEAGRKKREVGRKKSEKIQSGKEKSGKEGIKLKKKYNLKKDDAGRKKLRGRKNGRKRGSRKEDETKWKTEIQSGNRKPTEKFEAGRRNQLKNLKRKGKPVFLSRFF